MKKSGSKLATATMLATTILGVSTNPAVALAEEVVTNNSEPVADSGVTPTPVTSVDVVDNVVADQPTPADGQPSGTNPEDSLATPPAVVELDKPVVTKAVISGTNYDKELNGLSYNIYGFDAQLNLTVTHGENIKEIRLFKGSELVKSFNTLTTPVSDVMNTLEHGKKEPWGISFVLTDDSVTDRFDITPLINNDDKILVKDDMNPVISADFSEGGVEVTSNLTSFVDVVPNLAINLSDNSSDVDLVYAELDGADITTSVTNNGNGSYTLNGSEIPVSDSLNRSLKLIASDKVGNIYEFNKDFKTVYTSKLNSSTTFNATTGFLKDGKYYGNTVGDFVNTNSYSLGVSYYENEDGTKITGEIPVGVNKLTAVTDTGFKFPANLTVEVVEDNDLPVTTSEVTKGRFKEQSTFTLLRDEESVVYFKSTDNSGISKVVVLADGEEIQSDEIQGDKTFSFTLPVVRDVTFEVKVTDISGNTSSNFFTYKLDQSVYSVSAIKGLDPLATVGNKGYLFESKKGSVEVTGDYITSLTMNELPLLDDVVNIEENGEYSVKITNIWGEDVITNILDKLVGTTNGQYVIDKIAPTSEITASKKPTVVNGLDAYVSLPNLTVSASDDNLLSKVTVSVNGVETNSYENINSASKTFDIDFSNLDESFTYNVTVNTIDIVGNKTTTSYAFTKDNIPPSISKVTLENKDVVVYDNIVFLKEQPKISVTTGASFIGIDKVTLNGEEVDVNSPITVEDNTGGVLLATNKLGVSSSAVNVMDELGFTGKRFVVDNEKPTSTLNIQNTTSIDGVDWLVDKGLVEFDVSDNESIDTVILIVNGKEVFKTVESGFVLQSLYQFDLSKLSDEDKYDISVIVTDRVGNTTSISKTVNYDKTTPEVLSADLVNGSPIVRGNTVYLNESPKVSVKTNVGISGVAETFVDGVSSDFNDIVLDSGDNPVLSIENKVGKTSKSKDVMSLLGFGGKTLVVDKDKPTTNISLQGTKSIDGKDWIVSDSAVALVELYDNLSLQDISVKVNGVSVRDESIDLTLENTSVPVNFKDYSANADGSYIIEVSATDKAGNTVTDSKVIYEDTTSPSISNFNFIQEGYKQGSTLTVDSNSYGFFFNGSTVVRVEVADTGVTSGLDFVTLTLKGVDGSVRDLTSKVTGGYADFEIPNNFKGWVSAKVQDNVGLVSSTMKADGVITEDANWHVSTSKVNIELPSTPYRTADGLPLYNSDFNLSGTYSMPVSGVRSVQWSDGTTGGNITAYDLNLGVVGNASTRVIGNENNMSTTLTVTDNVGHSSSSTVNYSIDKDAPIIDVAWSSNASNNLYGSPRTATITINERNFNPSAVAVQGGSVSSWVSNGSVHTATVTFATDGKHQLSVSATDLAGNTSAPYQSETFSVDTTAPVISVAMSGNANNGNYFNQVRTATINVIDQNFDANAMKVEGGQVSWAITSDGAIGTVTFGEGEHSLTVSGVDALGHVGNTVTIDKFIVDTTLPELNITGVSDGASYTSNVFPILTFSDKYIDNSKVSATLKGRRLGVVNLSGSIQGGRLYLDGLPSGDYDDIYELTVHVEDLAGNVVTKSLTFSLNRNGSTYSYRDSDITGGYYKQLPRDLVLTETSVTRLDTFKTRYTYTLNGQVKGLDIKPTIREYQNQFGYWVYEYIFPKGAFKQNGVWGISVTTTDVNGKVSSSDGSVSIKFVIDDTAPTITVLDLEAGGTYYEATKFIKILISDNIGVTEASVFINGVEYKFTKEEIERGEKEIELERSNTPYDIKVVVKDATGNTSVKEYKDVLVTATAVRALTSSSKFSWLRYLVMGIIGTISLSVIYWWWLVTKRRREQEEELKNQAREVSTNNLTTGNNTSEKTK